MFLTNPYFLLKRLSKRLIVRAYISVALALGLALVAAWLGPFVPDKWPGVLGSRSVDEILKIVASSMLMVATFSLSTMVAAYSAASDGVTPRAARLLMEDRDSHNALSIFLGAFIFSIVSIIALSTEYYGEKGRFILFIFTVILLVVIVLTIVSWIEKLSKLGRVHETVKVVEETTCQALKSLGRDPLRGARCYEAEVADAIELRHSQIGYVQSINYSALQEFATQKEIEIFIELAPGAYVFPERLIAKVKLSTGAELTDEVTTALRSCFDVGTCRLYEEDPRFGFITLAEVASRALSPAVNDPGTAIDVISSMVRLINCWDECTQELRSDVSFDRLYVRSFDPTVFFEDIVRPLSRDGAAHIEVMIRLYKALNSFTGLKDVALSEQAKKYQKHLIERALLSLKFEDDQQLIQKMALK